MAYPKESLKLDFLFRIFNTVEIADTGLHISTLGSAPFDAVASLALWNVGDLEDLLGNLSTMLMAAGGLRFADYGQLVGAKLAAIGTDGRYLAEPLEASQTPTTGVSSDVVPQNSVCLSLWSGLSLGRANHGRMYLPYTQFAFNAAKPFTEAGTTAGLAANAASFIGQVNAKADLRTAGAGVVNLSKVGTGTVKAVAYVRVGRLVDTQRRRRNRLTEEHSQVAV